MECFTRNEKLLADPVRSRQISERIPAGRWGDPKDFAGPVIFLASQASQYVCGELLVVDGVGALLVLLFISPLTSLSRTRDGWAVELHSYILYHVYVLVFCTTPPISITDVVEP